MLGLSYTLHEIAQVVPARDLFQGLFPLPALKYLVYDSRRISHGEQSLFVALKTANRDGHDFIPQVIEKGVRHFIVDRPLPYPGINYILVDDTLEALQFWARHHRSRFSYPLIALTGSNGKTTVKEWLATLLEYRYQIVKSPMSHNSQLGVALSLLQMRPGADLALIEAGISERGEMERLWEMIQPDHGILTHMGPAHAEGFTSDEEKLDEKCMLFEGVDWVASGTHQAWVQQSLAEKHLPLISVGKEQPPGSSFHLQLISSQQEESGWEVSLQEGDQEQVINIPLKGDAALENMLLAILVARKLALSWEEIRSRLPLVYPVEMRTELITDNPEVSIINDSYNSDLDSIRNAFQMLAATEAHPKKCLIISDILHLGQEQEALQRQVLQEAKALFGPEQVWTVGPVYRKIRQLQSFAHTGELIRHFRYADVQT